MRKHPFLAFMAVMIVLVATLLAYIQTPLFARQAKQFVARYVPGDLGIDADFSEFAIKLYPPGLSLRNPTIALKENNILKMPAGSTVRAERIDLIFQPFQMLSGDIRVHEVAIVKGDLNLVLAQNAQNTKNTQNTEETRKKAAAPKKSLGAIHWDELLQIRAEAVSVEDTHVRIAWKPDQDAEFTAHFLRLGQWTGKGGLGYEAKVNLGALGGSIVRQIPQLASLESLQASAQVNAAGAKLNELVVQGPGITAEASLRLKGDVLKARALAMEGNLKTSAELERVMELIASKPSNSPKSGKGAIALSGKGSFAGEVQGTLDLEDLAKTFDTLKAKGRFGLENGRFENWHAERAELQGAWQAGPGGGELTVEKAVIESPMRARVGGSQPASGGVVRIGAVKLNLGKLGKESLHVPLELDHAHIHWLAAIALKDVYPLDFRVSGPIEATFTPASRGDPWELDAKLDLHLPSLQLDNQRLGKVKPLAKVLEVKSPINIKGAVRVDPTGLFPQVAVSLPRTKLDLAGKIDFKTGYDLQAHGNVQFEDIGQIAENDIRGAGPLSVHVHGPTSRVFVDFDADLDHASYLKMDLGRFKGRVTWDDDPQDLLLSEVRITQGKTSYTAEGKLLLGADEKAAIRVHVAEGNIQDLIQTFDYQTRDLWWFPRSLNGPVSGEVTVGGGLNMRKLVVDAKLIGTNWEYLGEKLDHVSLAGGYDRGRYHVSEFDANKHGSTLQGRISLGADGLFDWSFHTHGLSVRDFDWIAQLDVPFRGQIAIDSSGSGKSGEIRSTSQILVSDASVRGQSIAPSQVLVKSSDGITQLTASLEGGQGTVELSYDSRVGGRGFLRGEAKRFDFAPALLLLNSRLLQDPQLAGTVTGSVSLAFRSSEWEKASGEISLAEYVLAKTGSRFTLDNPVSLKVNEGSFDLKRLALAGRHGVAEFSLKSRSGHLDGALGGDIDLSIVEFLTSAVSKIQGTAALDFKIAGSLLEPQVSGRASFAGVSFQVPSVESPFENVQGSVQVRQNVLNVQGFSADFAGGRATSEGTVTVYADRFPLIDLRGTVSGSKIKVYPFQYAKIRGTLGVHGDRIPYLIDGDVTVESALSREKVLQRRTTESLKASQYTPPPTLSRASDYPKFKLGIDARSDGDILIQNDLFDAVAKGAVKVVNTLDTPRILGTAEIVRGKILFKDRVFQIQSATADFDNPTVINPKFTLTANTEVNGVKVQLYVSGTVDQMKPELSSNPVMPENEIIQLLALGMSSNDKRNLSQGDRTLIEQGEAGSLLLNSLGFNREVEEKTGVQIQLDESVNTQTGTSVFRPLSSSETAAAPKIVIRKRIADRVDLSVGNTVGVGGANSHEVNAEVQVTPNLSVIGVYDDFQSLDAKDKQTSYGLDLKLQKRFK